MRGLLKEVRDIRRKLCETEHFQSSFDIWRVYLDLAAGTPLARQNRQRSKRSRGTPNLDG